MNDCLVAKSGRSRAYEWPYPRHERLRENVATSSFQLVCIERARSSTPRKPYLLASLRDWRQNIILPEVADYFEAEMAVGTYAALVLPGITVFIMAWSSQAIISTS